jgi:hypothetical protein
LEGKWKGSKEMSTKRGREKVAKGSGNNWISFGEPHWSLAFECICIVVLWPTKRLCSLHPKAKYMSHAFMLCVLIITSRIT